MKCRRKKGVTIPEPFDFDSRDKFRKKSIREQKIEIMIEEKRLENSLKEPIRVKPIPASVLKPRYDAIVYANERRR